MSLKRSLYEWARCAKHNAIHLRRFKMGFRNPYWIIRHDRGRLRTTNYPYHACEDSEGYLKNGDWSFEPGQVVIDAGGCFGEFALYASQCVGPTGRVLLIEPDGKNLNVARLNARANGDPPNLVFVQAGLWHERGTVKFQTGRDLESAIVLEQADTGPTTEIPVLSLADIVQDYNLPRLDYVKMDIEGAELEALAAISHLPVGMRPRFAIASYHIRDGEQTAGRCEALLRAAGYTVETGNPKHLTTWASS